MKEDGRTTEHLSQWFSLTIVTGLRLSALRTPQSSFLHSFSQVQDIGEGSSVALLGLMVTGTPTGARGTKFARGHRQPAVWATGCRLI